MPQQQLWELYNMICLDNTDVIEGGASVDAVIDYTMYGLVGSTFTQLAAGVMNTTLTAVLYTAGAAISIVSIILVNKHSSAVDITLCLDPANGGNPRYIIPKTISLGVGYSLHTDGARITVMDTNGNIVMSQSGAVSDIAYDATTWSGVTTIAPSKNAVRDKIETLGIGDVTAAANITANVVVVGDDGTKGVKGRGAPFFLNLGIVASVSSKALTVALKGEDGNDPSASNKVGIDFRHPTIATGTPLFRTASGALSVVLSSGSTLGFTAAEAGRLYVWAIDNAGTVVLGLSRTADIFPESNVVSTTAEGGAGASDSETVMYSTAAQTDKACRCIGYIEITTGAVAGEWDNAPTKIQIMGVGVRRTGDIVQIVHNQTGVLATGTTIIPWDNTIPQNTEGDEYMTQAITPTSAINKFIIEHIGSYAINGAGQGMPVALFQDAIAAALVVSPPLGYLINAPVTISLRHLMITGTTNATTFKIRCGPMSALTVTFNGSNAGGLFGGSIASNLKVTEVFV